MKVNVIRPALIYGPEVKGNLRMMLKGIKQGWFPPLPSIGNKRSMVHVDDVASCISHIMEQDNFDKQIYQLTDGNEYSASEIYDILCKVSGKNIHSIRVPLIFFRLLSRLHPSIRYKINKLLGDETFSNLKIISTGFKPKKLCSILMKRIIDILISSALIVLMIFPMLLVFILIRIDSRGPGLYWSERVGKNNVNFMMPKFRTMHEGTASVATHLLDDPNNHLTRMGNILRRTSIDELPQLYSILRGQMTFVGPRPALFNQYDLIRFRTKNNVQNLLPGVTGWAQINGRDNISIQEKVMYDLEYLEKKSVLFDLHIILLTLLKVLKKEDVSH